MQGNVVIGPEVERFFCEIVPVSLTETVSAPIELTTELTDMKDGTYELTYSVPATGNYELAVKLFDRHIKGSPFQVEFKLFSHAVCFYSLGGLFAVKHLSVT